MKRIIIRWVLLFTILIVIPTTLNYSQVHPFIILDINNKYKFLNRNSELLNYKVNLLLNVLANKTGELNNVLQMDSIITSSVKGNSGLKVLFEYNVDSDIISQQTQGDTGSGWYNIFLDLYYYNENSFLIKEIAFGWNINNWDTLSRFNYTYTPEGKISQYVFQNYFEPEWVNILRVIFDYDADGNEITSFHEVWNNNKWQNNFFIENFYSKSNLRDSLLFRIWGNNEWNDYSRTYFSYNPQTFFLESFIAQFWDGSAWNNYFRRTILNDLNGNQIEQVDEIWNQDDWENSVRRFYSYSIMNYTQNAFCELWFNNNWIPGKGIIIIENPDGFSTAFETYRADIYYKATSVNEDIIAKPHQFVLEQNYPNPFNPSTTINFQTTQKGLVTLKIYDILGSLIETLVNEEIPAGKHFINFNALGIASGVYFYTLSSNEGTISKRMLLLK